MSTYTSFSGCSSLITLALHTRCHVEITISRAAEISAASVAPSELGGGYDSQPEVGFLTTNPPRAERSGAVARWKRSAE